MQGVPYDVVVECIKKPPRERTDAEVEMLYPAFQKLNKLFEELAPNVIKDIVRNCYFTERSQDNIIIRQGDKGDCFFVMLSGKVSIYINTEAVPDNPEEATVLVTEESFTETGQPGQPGKKRLDRSKYGNMIVTLSEAGKGFGEIALISKDCIRNASIIADEVTHLIVVDRDLYNRSLRSAQEAEFNRRINYVRDCDIFHKWPARYKRQAGMSLRIETFKYDQYIVKQGEPTDGLMFILKGLAKIIVDTTAHNTQYPHLRLSEDPEETSRKEIMAELGESLENRSDSRKLWDKPLRRQGYAAAEQRQAQKHMEICLVGPGEIIGDTEQGMDLPTYMQSVVCCMDTEIYILDAKNFERLCNSKRNPFTLTLLRRRSEVKLLNRLPRNSERDIPLYRKLLHMLNEDRKQEEAAQRFRQMSPETESTHGGSLLNNFIPQHGLLVDLQGPGTVFYRNKMKRLQKIERSKNKQQKPSRRIMGMLPATDISYSTNIEEEYENDQSHLAETSRVSKEEDDWETSSEHLEGLEYRLKQWHDIFHESERNKAKVPVVKLRRPKLEENNLIHPGKKIYLRPRHMPEKDEEIDYEEDTTFITKPGFHRFPKQIVTKPLSELKHRNKDTEENNLDESDDNTSPTNEGSSTPPQTKSKKKNKNDNSRKSPSNEMQHQYTPQEYQKLKQLLKKKERQLDVFRSSIAI